MSASVVEYARNRRSVAETDHVCVGREAAPMDNTIVRVHPDGTGFRIKPAPGHRRIPRRLDHRNSSGCRGCPNGGGMSAVPPERSVMRPGNASRPIARGGQGKSPLLTNRAHECDGTPRPALELGFGRRFPHPEPGLILGYATGKCAGGATGSDGRSGVRRDVAASSLDSESLTERLSASLCPFPSLMRCVGVNTHRPMRRLKRRLR